MNGDLIIETAGEGRILVIIYDGHTLIMGKDKAQDLLARLPAEIEQMKESKPPETN